MADPHPSVLVTNLTDALGKRPTLLGIYTCDLAPGESVLLPAHLIDEKFRPLELPHTSLPSESRRLERRSSLQMLPRSQKSL